MTFTRFIKVLFAEILFTVFLSFGYKATAQLIEPSFSMLPDTFAINEQLNNAKRYFFSGDRDSAFQLFENSLKQSRYSLYDYGVIKSLMGLGNIQINLGEYDKALNSYKKALVYCNNNRTRKALASLFNNMGIAYGHQGLSQKSMVHFEKALQYAEQYGSYIPMETLYNNISIPLERLGESEKSLYYLEKGAVLARKNHSFETLANIYLNKGTSHFSLKNWEKSRHYFQKALLTATKYDFPDIRYSAHLNIGLVALNTGLLEVALATFKNADTIKGNITLYNQNKRTIFLAEAYLKLKKFVLAERHLRKALVVSYKLNAIKEIIAINGMLSDLYAATGQYEFAFKYLSREKELNDSLNKKNALDAVTQIEIKYRSALKDKEIARNQFIIDRQKSDIVKRNVLIGSIATCLLLLFGFLFVQRRNYQRKQKLKSEQLSNLKRQQEIQVMKAIMNGEERERIRLAREIHDDIMVQFSVLKMNLSALVGREKKLIEKQKLNPLLEQLDEATNNLRRTAHNLMPDMLLEDGLPDALYCFCNMIQKNTMLEIVFHVLGNVPRFNVQFELSVYRIVQELVQNVIKHAAASRLIIQLSFENKLLSLTVEDNGKGMPQNTLSHLNGLGIKSIHARVSSLNGRITIDSQYGAGTSVHLEFDIES